MDGEGETANVKRWTVFHPVYIKTRRKQWRRVADKPRKRMRKSHLRRGRRADCCAHLSLPYSIEMNKVYPRDYMQIGRVRVLLKGEDGTLCNPAISSRKQLMLRVAELVPRHPGRIGRSIRICI